MTGYLSLHDSGHGRRQFGSLTQPNRRNGMTETKFASLMTWPRLPHVLVNEWENLAIRRPACRGTWKGDRAGDSTSRTNANRRKLKAGPTGATGQPFCPLLLSWTNAHFARRCLEIRPACPPRNPTTWVAQAPVPCGIRLAGRRGGNPAAHAQSAAPYRCCGIRPPAGRRLRESAHLAGHRHPPAGPTESAHLPPTTQRYNCGNPPTLPGAAGVMGIHSTLPGAGAYTKSAHLGRICIFYK